MAQWLALLQQVFTLANNLSKHLDSKQSAIDFLKKLDKALEIEDGDTSEIENLLDDILGG